MMPRPEFAFASAAALTMLACGLASAESASSAGRLYVPKSTSQSTPMRVEVLDGRRFRDIETGAVYRLYGIDACGREQTASLGRQPWPCGAVATAWLSGATLNNWVACAEIREEDGERMVRCASPGHQDLAADMLREGIAVVAPATQGAPLVRAYVAAEETARKAYRGLWSSTFQMPWEWRSERSTKKSIVQSEPAR